MFFSSTSETNNNSMYVSQQSFDSLEPDVCVKVPNQHASCWSHEQTPSSLGMSQYGVGLAMVCFVVRRIA
jgi:hypothetical protein